MQKSEIGKQTGNCPTCVFLHTDVAPPLVYYPQWLAPLNHFCLSVGLLDACLLVFYILATLLGWGKDWLAQLHDNLTEWDINGGRRQALNP